MNRSPSSALAYRRTLHIIRALQRKPHDRAALEDHVRKMEGDDAYAAHSAVAAKKAFEGDLERAHEQFGVRIRYDFSARQYRIVDLDAAGWLDLPDEAIDALALIYRTFDESAPEHDRVRRALDAILAWLPESRRERFLSRQLAISLDLRTLDSAIETSVLDRLRDALARRQAVRFSHRSPRHPHREALRYEAEPIHLMHQDGHWYLQAYVRWVEGQGQREEVNDERRFRVSYIAADGLDVLAEKLPPHQRPRRTFRLRYHLHPDIARGDISRRFDASEIRVLDDEWAEVTATIHDPFAAAQTLLRYGDKCVVLEPPEVVTMIRDWLWGMMALYVSAHEPDESDNL